MVVQDLATHWLQCYPLKNTSQESQKRLMKFLEPTRKPKVIYTVNSLEYNKSCEELSWNHVRQHHTDQKRMRLPKEQYAESRNAPLPYWLQSDLDEEWWTDSMERKTYLRNIQDLLSGAKTPHERRFGIPFNGPIIPFGETLKNWRRWTHQKLTPEDSMQRKC